MIIINMQKSNTDDKVVRTPSISTTASGSQADGYTFCETGSEKEFQLQISPTVKKANPHSLDGAIEVIAVAKVPTPGEEVESGVAVYVNTALTKQPLTPSGKKVWRLSK